MFYLAKCSKIWAKVRKNLQIRKFLVHFFVFFAFFLAYVKKKQYFCTRFIYFGSK